jgi:hypothetical protein
MVGGRKAIISEGAIKTGHRCGNKYYSKLRRLVVTSAENFYKEIQMVVER